VFALVRGREVGLAVGQAMARAYESSGLSSDTRVAQVDTEGARLIDDGSDKAP
jgi:hypothetical protein